MLQKIILIIFGLAIGLLAANLAASFLIKPHSSDGTEFSSVDDFRHSLLDPRAKGNFRKPDGSLPFAAIVQANPSDKIIYTLRPNLSDKFTGVQVNTNSQGMRNAEVQLDKPEGLFRLALLGDSFAFGWGVDENKIFARETEVEFNRDPGLKTLEVLNFGVPGYSTFQEVALFKEMGLKFKPDAVLVFLIHNDFDFPFFIRDVNAENGLVQSFSLAKLGNKVLNPLLQKEQAQMKGLGPNESLAELDDYCKEHQLKLFLAVNPRKDWRGIIKRLTVVKERPSIKLLEIGTDFENIAAKNGYSQNDLNLPNDIHPTALRHHIYGQLLAQNLKKFL